MRPNRTQALHHEGRAWELRCRGWSQYRIATELGLSQPGISKILSRVEVRELKRLSESVERIKVVQTGQLDHVIEESIEAWHRSKTPKKRAASKTSTSSAPSQDDDGDGQGRRPGPDEIKTVEVVERDGDPAYLYVAMNGMDRVRSLWGLDVAPAMQDPAASVAELARDLLKRSDAYEQRKTQEGQTVDTGRNGPPAPVGTPIVPEQPQSV